MKKTIYNFKVFFLQFLFNTLASRLASYRGQDLVTTSVFLKGLLEKSNEILPMSEIQRHYYARPDGNFRGSEPIPRPFRVLLGVASAIPRDATPKLLHWTLLCYYDVGYAFSNR